MQKGDNLTGSFIEQWTEDERVRRRGSVGCLGRDNNFLICERSMWMERKAVGVTKAFRK